MSEQWQFLMRMHIMLVTSDILKEVSPLIAEMKSRLDSLEISHTVVSEPYWKIPDCQEVRWRLESDNAPEKFEELLRKSGVTWSIYGTLPSKDAVWNKGDETLLSPNVIWCIVQLFPTASVVHSQEDKWQAT